MPEPTKCRAEDDICTLPSRSCIDCTPTPSTVVTCKVCGGVDVDCGCRS